MRHHTIVCRLGRTDTASVALSHSGSHVTELHFIDGDHRLGFGLGKALDQLRELGVNPSERAVDLALLAAVLTAADTRVSRATESQDAWTREIGLCLPVSEPKLWQDLAPLIRIMLDFLTGDRWDLHFRPRIASLPTLVTASEYPRTITSTSVCLFSGGLDSFIGAINLFTAAEDPFLVSHYWDGITSKYQNHCAEAIRARFPKAEFHHLRVRVGFPNETIKCSTSENTLRARSFLFFALAALAADALGGDIVVHVPENGLISLNVPLDPQRLGALSTRTTHPFYMARFNELLKGLGMSTHLNNAYRHQTKGKMAKLCSDQPFLRQEARNTMSCSSPAKARFVKGGADRKPKNCGYCVPCLIRRAALIEGLGIDDTIYQIPNLKARVLNTNKAEGEHIRSFQLALSRLAKKPDLAKFDIHRPGPLNDHPNDLDAYVAVHVDGLLEVGRLLAGVKVKPL